MTGKLLRLTRLAVDVRPDELAALLWSFAYFFALLCGYYVLRPIRDEMGVQSGVEKLPWRLRIRNDKGMPFDRRGNAGRLANGLKQECADFANMRIRIAVVGGQRGGRVGK